MPYTDFTMRSAAAAFGLTEHVADLFAGVPAVPVPGWLADFLAHTERVPRVSEKARGEVLVMPVLAAACELAGGPAAVYSGVRMDVDPTLGLAGECDYLITRTPPFPEPHPPVVTVAEAKKADIDLGLGQCIAQMVAARVWNEREEVPLPAVYGCVTSGEIWQFLRLAGSDLTVDGFRYQSLDLPRILGVLVAVLAPPPGPGPAAV